LQALSADNVVVPRTGGFSGGASARGNEMLEHQKSRGPRYPFAWLGVPLGLILLFTIGPTVSLLVGGAVSGALGCNSPISATEPCLFMGVDLGGAVTMAILFGFLGLVTLPIGTTLLGIWFVAAVIVTLVWWPRRWRANANG
jgi:hypothetical protein